MFTTENSTTTVILPTQDGQDRESVVKEALITGTPVQVGKYVINIAKADSLRIGDLGLSQEDLTRLRSVIHQVAIDIEQDKHDRCLKSYFLALKRLESTLYGSLSLPRGRKISELYIRASTTQIPSHFFEKQMMAILGGDGGNIPELQQNVSFEEILGQASSEQDDRIVLVLGEPGSGKSSMLRYMALNAWSNYQRLGLESRHIPLYIKLKCISQSTGNTLGDQLWSAMTLNPEITLHVSAPSDYFSDWPERMKARWLILLDGLDEVPHGEQSSIQKWLLGLRNIGSVIVVTSRYSSNRLPALEESCRLYNINSLTEAQQVALATNLCGEESHEFLSELESATPEIRELPLMLSISAALFLYEKTSPAKVAQLYNRFLEVVTKEAWDRGLREDLDGLLDGHVNFFMERLALVMTANPAISDVAELSKVIAPTLSKNIGCVVPHAEALSIKLLNVLAKHMGLFQIFGTEIIWNHATFRELLAARALLQTNQPMYGEEDIFEDWRNDNWRQVVRAWFCEKSFIEDISEHVESFVSYKNEYNDCFDSWVLLAQAASDGANFPRHMNRKIAEELCAIAREKTRYSLCDRVLSMTQGQVLNGLVALQKVDDASEELVQQLKSYMAAYLVEFGSQTVDDVRVSALEDLEVLSAFDELYSIGTIENVDAKVRVECLRRLPVSYRTADVSGLLLDILRLHGHNLGYGSFGTAYVAVASLLKRERLKSIETFVNNIATAERARFEVANALASEGYIKGLMGLRGDETLTSRTRFDIEVAIFRFEKSDENREILLSEILTRSVEPNQQKAGLEQLISEIKKDEFVSVYTRLEANLQEYAIGLCLDTERREVLRLLLFHDDVAKVDKLRIVEWYIDQRFEDGAYSGESDHPFWFYSTT